MKRTCLIGTLAACLAIAVGLRVGDSLRHAIDYAWWSFLIGIAIGLVFEQMRHPPLEQTSPFWYPLDRTTAMHTLKSALLSSYPRGGQWRILHCDPDTGLLAACLDARGVLSDCRTDSEAAVREQILLVAELQSLGEGTGVWLRWQTQAAKRPGRASYAIERTTQRIKSALAEQCTPELIVAKR